MEKIKSNGNVQIKKGVKIALKTLLDSFVVIMLLMCSIFVMIPKLSLKIHQTLGMEKMQELNHKMIYSRSDNVADLYNLIIFEGEQSDYQEELSYIDAMIARADYKEFCDSMDTASLEKISSDGLNAYSANVNGYLLSRKVVCMYELNQEGMDSYIYRQTNSGKISEYSFSTYVDLIYFDESLTKEEKAEKLSTLIEISDIYDGRLLSLEDLLKTRVYSLKTAVPLEQDENKKDVLRYTLMRIYASRYYVYDAIGNSELKNENYELYKAMKVELAG